jgi:class 3 adenylate cyclase
MFIDIVGYSASAQKNETLTLDLLEEYRNLLRPLFPPYGGRIIDTTGDGFFVEIDSALEAARCAIAIQKIYKVPQNLDQPIREGRVGHSGERSDADATAAASCRVPGAGGPGSDRRGTAHA